MNEFEAILFDFDGVLADTEPLHWASWKEALAPLGVKIDWKYYVDVCVGVNDRVTARNIAEVNPPLPWEDLWALYPEKKRVFRERTLANPPFDPALGSFLAGLHREHKLGVVSSSSSTEIEPLLTCGGLRDHFDIVVGGDHVKNHKPAPDPYLLASERLGTRSILVVEDSAPGIASGRAAGFEVLPIPNPADLPRLVRQRLEAHRG